MTPAQTLVRPPPQADPALDALVRAALERGLDHAREFGTPIQPFLLTGGGALDYLFDAGSRSHPTELAVRLMLSGARAADAERLALVTGAQLRTPAGRRTHAVLVLACARGAAAGEVWAQGYRPRRWYRGFSAGALPWRIGEALNLFAEAARGQAPQRSAISA